MIEYIKGILSAIGTDSIIVENQGIGYHINVPVSVLNQLPPTGMEVKIHTYLHVREDLLQMFGFLSRDDLEVFRLLITVNGIGPKGGLAILGIMSSDELRFAVLSEDAKSISKTPGIGAKTASKLILELKDKWKLEDVVVDSALDQGEAAVRQQGADQGGYTLMISDAVEALVALGYSSADSMRAVRQVERQEDMTVERLLKLSLKKL